MSGERPPTSAAASGLPNRLGSTLFLAALAHGVVILGITFSVLDSNSNDESPSIKVTMLLDAASRQPTPPDAEFIANRNQLGRTNTSDQRQPKTAVSAVETLTVNGTELGADLRDGLPKNSGPVPEQLFTRGNAERHVTIDPDSTEERTDVPMRAAALLNMPSEQTLAAEIGERAELPDNTGSGSVAAPSTKASVLAAYLDGWRRRVERVGTANFPVEFLNGNSATERPTLAVTIGADGRLEEIVIQASSGDRAIDQAALTILRMAGPFEPLPDVLLADYDRLRFAYEWAFIDSSQQ